MNDLQRIKQLIQNLEDNFDLVYTLALQDDSPEVFLMEYADNFQMALNDLKSELDLK